ncbi:MAG: hypothetical protein LAT76_13365 [Schleiferiaceae bacterium]|nr:hypothetical protein [Schleiferiaceae bacterium]
MKFRFINVLLFLPFLPFAQTADYEVLLFQHGKKVAIHQNTSSLDKSPFQLVYKFATPQNWVLIAGKGDSLDAACTDGSTALQQLIQMARFGGADNDFNLSKTILAQEGERETAIGFVDEGHHSFDSIYQEGKWMFGVRTIAHLATWDTEYLIEEWPDSILILATGQVTFEAQNKSVTNAIGLRLYLQEVPPFAAFDVKGRTYLEEGEALFQEGCEGCGNLGYFEFFKNGKEVQFLRSGSDIFRVASYTQTGNQVTLEDSIQRFIISTDGKQLTDLDFGTKYHEVLTEED